MMRQQKWIEQDGILYPIVGDVLITEYPGKGIWQAYQNPNPADRRIGLQRIGDKFEFDYKIYNFGGQDMFDKINTVWNSKAFKENNKNLGIIYNGAKGAGKTVSAKLLCNKLDLPVIIINRTFEGQILEFIQSIEFECIVFIDEAEKTFVDGDQEILLKVIDGVYNKSRKLYILTTNRLTLNENLISRPGRIRYIQEFGNLSPEAVNMYIDDNLDDPKKKELVLDTVDLLEISTIDILRSIVEEVNILGTIDVNSNLNIPKANYVFDILKMEGHDETDMPKVLEFIKNLPEDTTLYDWLNSSYDIPEEADELSVDRTYDGDGRVVDRLWKELGSNGCCYLTKITTKFPDFFKYQKINIGEIEKSPEDLKDPRFLVVKSDYDAEKSLCMIVRKRGNPSLYGHSLRSLIL